MSRIKKIFGSLALDFALLLFLAALVAVISLLGLRQVDSTWSGRGTRPRLKLMWRLTTATPTALSKIWMSWPACWHNTGWPGMNRSGRI